MTSCEGPGDENSARRAEMEKLHQMALTLFSRGQIKESATVGKKCLEIAIELDDTVYKMFASHVLMLAHREIKNNDIAIQHGEDCIGASHIVGEVEMEMFACFVVGKLYFYKGQYEKSAVVSERGLACAIELSEDRYQAMIYLLLQDCYFHLEKYQEAIKAGDKCRSMCRIVKDVDGECFSYCILSKTFKALNNEDDSTNARLKSIDVATEAQDLTLLFTIHFRHGKMFYEQRKYAEAITHFQKALETHEDIYIHMALSECYQNQGNDSDALKHGLKCLAMAKQRRNQHAEVDVLALIAKVFESMDKNTQALLNINKAVAITEEAESDIHDHHDNLYFQQGMIYKSLHKYQDAIKSFEKCIAAAKIKGSKQNEMKSYFYIGNSNEFMNKFEEAIEYYNKYMTMSKEVGDEVDELEAYLALGVAHLGLDQYDRAYSYLEDGKMKAEQGRNEFLLKQFNEQLNHFKQHIGLETDIPQNKKVIASVGNFCLATDETQNGSNLDDHDKKGINSFKKCAEYREKGQLEEAIVCMREYIHELAQHPHYHAKEKVQCILTIVKMHANLHQFDKALQCCEEGLEIANKVNSCHLKAECHLQAGEVYYRTLQFPKAIESFKKSVHYVEEMMKNTGTNDQEDEFKIALLELHSQSYKNLELAYIHCKQLEKALIVSDNSRAKSLKDLLQKYDMQENNAKTDEESLQMKHVQELVSTNSCAILLYSTNRCDNCEGFYTYRIDKENGLLFSGEAHRPDAPSINETLSKALLLEMKIDEIVGAENRSLDEDFPNTSHNNGSTQHKQPPSKEDQSKALPGKKCTTKPKKKKESHESALVTLHRLLLDNCMCAIKNGKVVFSHGCPISQDEIVFVPDGSLFMVPFAALKDPRTGRYLCETKRIRTAPSITTLKLLNERPKDLDSKGEALIIGNPSVGKVMYDGKEREFSDLFKAEIEAKAISNLFRVQPLTADQATKSAVLERLSQGVSVVHIAAHGDVQKAAIALAPSTEVKAAKVPEEEDYMLTMADIQKTQVKAQLVVLSCCQSGYGEIKDEGVIGMCRAFLASGARAVVGSLWDISDGATLDFMTQFYLNLIRKKKSASLSLQLAMQYMMKDREYHEPKYWAPFFLMGDDVTINF